MTSAHRNQLWFWTIAAVVAVALFFFIARWRARVIEREQNASFLTGDPVNGARLYEVKSCASCHPLDAPPAHGAPDLRAAPEGHASFNTLVSTMWNHAPSMWLRMTQAGVKYPNLTDQDVADLFSFLYVIRYADEPGSPSHGEQLFTSKGCVQCHAIQGQGGREGPDLARVENADAPIIWAQMMWNHALTMRGSMQRQLLDWPRFEDTEMGDLLAYLRSVNTSSRRLRDLFPADVRRGRQLFGEKGCSQCHGFGGEGATVAPDLTRLPQMPRNLSQMSAHMWNHWPQMAEWMKQRKIPPPVFEGKEMADLIAYLYSLRYFDEPGRSQAGRQVYVEKRCDRCHGTDGRGSSDGPNLVQRKGTFSVVALAAAMWRHGPHMHREMQQKGLPWPKFRNREMDDLIAYLNTW